MHRDLTSWKLTLAAANKAKTTIEVYASAVEALGAYLAAQGMPTRLEGIRREHVESFLADLFARRSAATAHNRYRALQQFFKWAEEDGLLQRSPMAHTQPPIVPEKLVPVVDDPTLDRLLKSTGGTFFEDRRDHAIIRLLNDAGMRRAELVSMTLGEFDLAQRWCIVFGKGRRRRVCHFGARTALAFDRYLRLREKHKHAQRPEFWIGMHGPLTGSGVHQMLDVRSQHAGVERVYGHRLRHTFAHVWKKSGASDDDLMRLALGDRV